MVSESFVDALLAGPEPARPPLPLRAARRRARSRRRGRSRTGRSWASSATSRCAASSAAASRRSTCPTARQPDGRAWACTRPRTSRCGTRATPRRWCRRCGGSSRRVDPALPVSDVRTLAAIVDDADGAAPRPGARARALRRARRAARGRRHPRPARLHGRRSRAQEIGVPHGARRARLATSSRLVLRPGRRGSPSPASRWASSLAYAAGRACRRCSPASARATSSTFAAAAFVAGLTALAGSLLPAWRAAARRPAQGHARRLVGPCDSVMRGALDARAGPRP